ncbi:MAG: pilus assembly protein [Bacilli bacterium]|nr:pilus assembly protein [Bacilli bacterium]
MNKKGQALVEFILILPVILMVFMALIDIGSIFVQKIDLNNSMNTVSDLYQNGDKKELMAYVAKENLKYDETLTGDMVTLMLKKNVTVSAPILSNVLGKKYQIETSKVVYVGDKNE